MNTGRKVHNKTLSRKFNVMLEKSDIHYFIGTFKIDEKIILKFSEPTSDLAKTVPRRTK